MKSSILTALENFHAHRILVIGDVMLDQYMIGHIRGMSPEAPVPIVDFQSKEAKPGGAANVALNIVSLGAKVELIGIIGDDRAGKELLELCDSQGINTGNIIRSSSRKTTCKTRIIADDNHLLRFDEEQKHPLDQSEFQQLKDVIANIDFDSIDLVILQDYNKGLLNGQTIPLLLEISARAQKRVIVDPKLDNWEFYKGIHLIKPNLRELEHVLNNDVRINESSLKSNLEKLRQRLQISNVMVTLADQGNAVSSSESFNWIKAPKLDVVDVCGAGDAVIAAIALGITEELSNVELGQLANVAGRICCEHLGVHSPDLKSLRDTCKKIYI